MTVFYLGTHRAHWLRLLDVPLFVSRNRLAHRKTLPRARGPWALDSGGFTELSQHGSWRRDAIEYAAEVHRFRDEIGNLAWAAPMDWMCEPSMLAKTGLSVADHQRRTVANFLRLRDLAPELPFVPVVQGWTLADYRRCVDLYAAAGVDLASETTVGVGSVCRRQATGEIDFIVSTLAEQGLRLHGFGVKTRGLATYAPNLVSADSMAWSYRGRRSGSCTHGSRARSEANCLTFALDWRRRTLAVLAAPHQLALPLAVEATRKD